MCAGAVDHATHIRDVRVLRGLRAAMPVTAFAAGLAALSKAGFPPFFGFLGKEYVYKTGTYLDHFVLAVLCVAVATNMMLMALAFKAGVHPFWGKRAERAELKNAHESPLSMLIGPVVLALAGLALGLFPGILAGPWMGPAVLAVAGHPVELELSLWHGFNLPLLLSGLTLVGGFTIYNNRHWIWARISDPAAFRYSFDNLYRLLFDGFVAVAAWQTRVLQSGYLRRYLLIILGSLALLVGFKLSYLDWGTVEIDLFQVDLLGCAVAAVILVSLIIIVTTHVRITALLSMGLVGFGVAVLFIMYGAPDLGITQIVVETLAVVLFMIVIYQLPEFRDLSSKKTKIVDGFFALTIGLGATLLVLKAQHSLIAPSISGQFGEWSYRLAHGKNVVNVILVDFRALDTMGEISVLAVAAIGVSILIREGRRKSKTVEQSDKA